MARELGGRTLAGAEVYATKMARRTRLFARLVDGWSENDVDALTALLRRLNESIAALRPTLLDEIGQQSHAFEETR